MHQSLPVGIVQSVGYRSHQLGNVPITESTLSELRPEIGPFDVFGDDIARKFLRVSDIIYRYDARMIEACDCASLG
jgi:hypothetical protein